VVLVKDQVIKSSPSKKTAKLKNSLKTLDDVMKLIDNNEMMSS